MSVCRALKLQLMNFSCCVSIFCTVYSLLVLLFLFISSYFVCFLKLQSQAGGLLGNQDQGIGPQWCQVQRSPPQGGDLLEPLLRFAERLLGPDLEAWDTQPHHEGSSSGEGNGQMWWKMWKYQVY